MTEPAGQIPHEKFLEHLFDGVVLVDPAGLVTGWNKSAERITGRRAPAVTGKAYLESAVAHIGEDAAGEPTENQMLLSTLKDGLPREGRAYLKHVEGFRIPVAVRTLPLRDAAGAVTGAAEIFTDNKSMIAVLQNTQSSDATVLFDSLTGIGNRPHIEVKIKTALHAFLAGGLSFGVLFMDIDHFKSFNDTYGHLTGDKILRFVAQSIRNNLRTSDSCGRWGGEEFIAVLMDIEAEGLRHVAEKLRQVIAQTQVTEADQSLSVTISIGATLVHPDDTLQTLIQRVDQLMYQSKLHGRNQVTAAA
ncbi:MAG TPA: diguanylate cyclase [Anaerolineales bacterium]|jgi:diguanylate cyclase (GGDEF)-like protein/PAS domain S-box-containing protein